MLSLYRDCGPYVHEEFLAETPTRLTWRGRVGTVSRRVATKQTCHDCAGFGYIAAVGGCRWANSPRYDGVLLASAGIFPGMVQLFM